MANPKNTACDLWMWDGAGEYEGLLLKLENDAFTARLRQVRKTSTVSGLGKRLPAATPEAQRQFARRRFLAHVEGTAQGSLFEVRLDAVQPSSDADYDCIVSGRFGELNERQLEMLRTVSVENAAAMLQRDAS